MTIGANFFDAKALSNMSGDGTVDGLGFSLIVAGFCKEQVVFDQMKEDRGEILGVDEISFLEPAALFFA